MCIEILDKRLGEVLPQGDYDKLKAKADELYRRLEQAVPEPVFKDMLELLLILREVEMRLLEDRFRERYAAYAYVAKGTVG